MPNLCFSLRWDPRVTHCNLVCLGDKTSTHYFSCSGGTGVVSIKSVVGDITPNFYFPSDGICGSCSAFQCDRGVKRRLTIFHSRFRPIRIQQKARWDMLRQTSIFSIRWDLRVTQSILVHPSHERWMHYFSFSGGTGTDFTKSAQEHITSNLCFCHWWDLWIT
jgi:hypothetical protein